MSVAKPCSTNQFLYGKWNSTMYNMCQSSWMVNQLGNTTKVEQAWVQILTLLIALYVRTRKSFRKNHSYCLIVLIVRPENRKIELKDKVVFLAMLNCSTLESVEIVVSTCHSYILNCMRRQTMALLSITFASIHRPIHWTINSRIFSEQQLVYLLVEIFLGKNNLTSKSNLSFEWL